MSINDAMIIKSNQELMLQNDSDFAEGVRALLVDRDNQPQWKHKTYKDVPQVVIYCV